MFHLVPVRWDDSRILVRTFFVQTLGCKVNQYESEQVAAFLRSRGLTETQRCEEAELRIINSCSVTVQAASQSRQSTRRATRLPVLSQARDDRSVYDSMSVADIAAPPQLPNVELEKL